MANPVTHNTLDPSRLPVLLKSEEAAALLRLEVHTVRRMAQRGELVAVKLGRQWRYKRDSVMQQLEALGLYQ